MIYFNMVRAFVGDSMSHLVIWGHLHKCGYYLTMEVPPKNQIRLNFVLRTKHLKHVYSARAQDDPQEMERN